MLDADAAARLIRFNNNGRHNRMSSTRSTMTQSPYNNCPLRAFSLPPPFHASAFFRHYGYMLTWPLFRCFALLYVIMLLPHADATPPFYAAAMRHAAVFDATRDAMSLMPLLCRSPSPLPLSAALFCRRRLFEIATRRH